MLKHANAWKSHFPEFTGCGEAVVLQLMEAASLVTVPAGRQVFYPGKACENYLLLLSGSIKAQILSADGREVLLYRVVPGDSCVLTTSCLLGDSQYPAEGYAETDVEAFAIPAHVFHRCLQQSAFFRDFVFRNFSTRLADVIKRMAALSFASIDQRLAQTLLAAESGTIHKTHQELALELGSVREVVSRHLKRFESLGWVNLHRGSIEIADAAALRQLLVGD